MSQGTQKGSKAVMAIALIAIILAAATMGLFLTTPARGSYSPATHTREFYVFTTIIDFNETALGIPHDIFATKTIEVNQGDQVVIHFYNNEPISKDEHHTFTIPAYNIDVDLAPGQKQDIRFTASQAGIFDFLCKIHMPTMQGELIVLKTQ